jgi:protein involved in polysaccharide export with SLBB domain
MGVALLSGCGGGGHPPIRTETVPFTPEQRSEIESARSAEYTLRSGDRLALDFKYEDALDSTDLLVLPDGRLTLPGGVDPVVARGLSISELDSVLTESFGRDYVNPELSVMIERLADLVVYVMGFVERPGAVEMPDGGMNVLQAIAEAGGYDEDAAESEVVLLRVTPDGFMLRQLDLSHLEKRGFTHIAMLDLQPYDVLYVPRTPIGDFSYFADTFVGGLLNFGELFWDIYAISNLHKVENIWRR